MEVVFDIDKNYESVLRFFSYILHPIHSDKREQFFKNLANVFCLDNRAEDSWISVRVGLRRIETRRLRAAVMAERALKAIEAGQVANSIKITLKEAVDDLLWQTKQDRNYEICIRPNESTVYSRIWLESMSVLPASITILNIVCEKRLSPGGILLDRDINIINLLSETEINRRRLISSPVFGCETNKFYVFTPNRLRIITTRFNNITDLLQKPPINTSINLTYTPFASPYIARNKIKKSVTRQAIFENPIDFRFIKPVRNTDTTPSFDWKYGEILITKKLRPTIIADANVYARFEEFASRYESVYDIDGTGLDLVCKTLADGPTAYFNPGLAFHERGPLRAKRGRLAMDHVLRNMVPGLIDEIPGENIENFHPSGTPYAELPEYYRMMVGPIYLTLLRCRLAKELNSLKELQFLTVINYMATRLNVIGAMETEIAKHNIFDYNGHKNTNFYSHSKNIKNNFPARMTTIKNLKKEILNAARDMGYIKITLNPHESKEDIWLLTADNKIKSLFDVIRFEQNEDGSNSGRMVMINYPERDNIPYWRFVDAIHCRLINDRINGSRLNIFPENHIELLDKLIKETEVEIANI